MIKLSINRPVTVVMFYIALATIGIISFYKLPFEPQPNAEYPTLTISASWKNASPETMEREVTSPLESAIEGLSHVYETSSTSYPEFTRITVKYERDTDMDMAYITLNEKVFMVKKDLPVDVKRTVRLSRYVPRDIDDDEALLRYQIFGERNLSALLQFAEENIENHLTSIEGVSNVEITGASKRSLEILIDRDKAKIYNINPYRVRGIIGNWGNRQDVGIVDSGSDKLTMIFDNRFNTFSDILNIPIKKEGVNSVFLKDIATIVDGIGDSYRINRINGQSTIFMTIDKEAGKNAIHTADRVFEKVEEIKKELPKDINLLISSDSTEKMREDLADIKTRAIISVIIITLVLLFFLRDIKTPFIILLTILISILMTMTFLYFSGNTINVITLSGLVLAFGLLVDNSIVVMENIYHKLQKGIPLKEAAYEGGREMIQPVIAATFTTCIVFLPFLDLQGDKSLYWEPLALVVSAALISSLIVSFTLIPTLTKAVAKGSVKKVKEYNGPKFLQSTLHLLIRNKIMTLIFTILIIISSWYLFDKYVDRGQIFDGNIPDTISLWVSMPTGSTIEMTDRIITGFEKEIGKMKGYKKFESNISSDNGSIRVIYEEDSVYTIKPFEMEAKLVSLARNFAGPRISVYNPLNPSGSYRAGGSTSKRLSSNFAVKGFSYEELKREAEVIANVLEQNSRVSETDINSTGRFWRQVTLFNYIFDIDRESLGKFKTSVRDILNYIMVNVGGSASDKINLNSDEVDLSIKYSDYNDFTAEELRDLKYEYGNKPFKIGDTGSIVKKEVMSEITKEDQSYKRIVAYDYRGSSKAANKFNMEFQENYKLPTGYSFAENEYSFMTSEEEEEILWVIGIAIVLVFMITAALFESLWHPIIVILTVPLGMVGVFLIFFFMDVNFNRESYMGAILLSGIAVNNSIILVNHINHFRKQGETILESVIRGTMERFRPILMTTTTTVLGVLPLFVNSDAEKNFWYTLSLVTVGGLIASTIFVLTIIPVLYVLVESFKQKLLSLLSLVRDAKV
jgi:HAE1 family hydrophobic/amphiphilic exporter-1